MPAAQAAVAGGLWPATECSPSALGGIVARDRNEAINSYISDMLSLEDHIEKAVRSQLEDLKDLHRRLEHHISDLRSLSERRNAGGIVESVKRAGSVVAGVAAGVIDLIRSEGLPKNLRDDYTAFSLASIGYSMLYTTALALDDQEVAELAQVHFSDYAGAVIRLHKLVPTAVVRYLRQEGLPASEGVLPEINRTIEEVWRTQWGQAPAAEGMTAARNL
jgi:hypothetical protein